MLVNPPIKKGPNNGRYQPEPRTKEKKRYLLDKPIKTGPQHGKFQPYGHGKKRYLLNKG